MLCAYCNDPINGKPIRQAGELYCSLECANAASGIETDEPEEYYEEVGLEEYFEEEE